MSLFSLDGVTYNVEVTKLVCAFSILDTKKTGRTMDGGMYRDPIGTFYNYTMTIAPKIEDPESFDALFDALSQPVISHVCVFPYGQQTLTQRMYVTDGQRALLRRRDDRNMWGDITLNFVAMNPEVVV